MYYSKLIACGGYLPKKILTNDYFASFLETSDEWITTRTGIKQRHIASESEMTSDLAVSAFRNALNSSGIEKDTIDGIIVATTTPDIIFPSVATIVQDKMHMKNNSFAFDVNGVCTGFIHALVIADSMIKASAAKRIAVIGAETMSRILDWKDRSTVVLFGDGAGVFILEKTDHKLGVIDSNLYSDGSLCNGLQVPGGVSSGKEGAKVQMNGREVFKVAVSKGTEVTKQIMERNAITPAQLDCLIMHQANVRILDAVAKKLDIDDSKIVKSIIKHANTSAASIHLAFCDKFGNSLPENKNIIFTGFGAGMSWGSIYFKL